MVPSLWGVVHGSFLWDKVPELNVQEFFPVYPKCVGESNITYTVKSQPFMYADRDAFEDLLQMLDEVCSKKKEKLCKKYGIPAEPGWSQEQFLMVLSNCVKERDLEGRVHVFRQWHCFLRTEHQQHTEQTQHPISVLQRLNHLKNRKMRC